MAVVHVSLLHTHVPRPSDRLEQSAAAKRGSGSVGHAAEMDRRALMQDVLVLRDTLAQTHPEEAMRLTKDLAV